MDEKIENRFATVVVVGLLGGIWLLVTVIYRLYFHPLSKYPGPFLAKVTDWYNVYHCFVGDRHIEFQRIHQKYGTIVRYGPNRVSINSATALKTIYNPKANCRKSSHFAVFPKFFHSWSTQSMIDTETFQHSNKRRAISNGLHGKATKHIEESVTRNLEKLCSIITKNILYDWSSSFNVAEMFNYLSFDIMGDVCFGRTFNMQEQKEHRYIVDIVSDGAQCLNTLGHMQKLLYTGLHRVLFRKLLNGLKSYQRYSKEQCAQAIADPPKNIDQRGVFQFLLDAESPKTGNPLFTPLELQSESSLLIIAGSDTTSTCLAATVFYLLHHPSCMKEAIEEVSSVFSQWKEGLLEPSELQKCRYLRACIEESLRMSPPVGGLMPRETLVGGMTVDGEHFPENTELGTPHYAIHHNERYYPDPFSYNPRRWLVDSTPQSSESATTPAQLAAAEEAFCPFSIGPRNCVGKQFAYHELMSVMARLLLQFDMRLQPGSTLGEGSVSMGAGRQRKDEYQLYDAFASKNEGPMVQFRRRRR